MSGEAFNNPFAGLAPLPAPSAAPRQKPLKTPPAGLSLDFGAEDEAASAMFMEAMGKAPGRKKSDPGPASRAAPPQPTQAATGKARAWPDDGLQSLAGLFAAQNPARGGASPEERVEDLPEVELSEDEASSFARAMQGVRPVDESRGRALAPAAARPPAQVHNAGRDYLAEFTAGKYEFALEYTEEFFEGHVLGLDPLALAKLRAGQYSAETHIDLHGLNAEQAYGELVAFVKSAYSHDYRHLLVITGRGKNSPGGLGVLRQNMQEWLTKEPLRRVVLAFCTAQPKDGGAGALYVLLRKYKKSRGKVRWDITPPGV